MTRINTSGEKVETKVFAGGTHIATQYEMDPATTNDDQLKFVTADPVTGSVANYSSSGASADIDETEPLGQTVETFDPGSGYPTSYEDIRGIARDPEWQCRVAELKRSTFNEMPIHCKKAALADKNFSLPAALAESDPKRVAQLSLKLIDSPIPKFHLPDGGSSPSNLVMAFVSKATDKSSTKEGEGGCDWDKDGTDDCATTITNPGPDPIDGLASADASVSGAVSLARQTVDGPRYLKSHDVVGDKWYPRITNMLMDIFGNEDCVKAFADAGIDLAAVWKKGFYIGSVTLILDTSIPDEGTKLPSNVRRNYLDHYKKNRDYLSKVIASTIVLGGKDDIPRIFLGHEALNPGFFSTAEATLRAVLIHELIHVGGKGKVDPGLWKYLGYDDLMYMQKEYENILKNCQ